MNWILGVLALFFFAQDAVANKKVIEQQKKAKQAEHWEHEIDETGWGLQFLEKAFLAKPMEAGGKKKIDKRFAKMDVLIPRSGSISDYIKAAGLEDCPIINQGSCGSCVYNSGVQNYCMHHRARGVNIPPISRSEIMQCTDGGRCSGEWMLRVFGYMKKLHDKYGGLLAESDFGYVATSTSSCRLPAGKTRHGKMQDAGKRIDNSFKSVATALYLGYPVGSTVGADSNYSSYKSGRYGGNACTRTGTNHQTLTISWDCETSYFVHTDGKEYCKFDSKGDPINGDGTFTDMNSWAERFGDKGKITMAYKHNGRLCNNHLEEATIFESGIPMPTPKPDGGLTFPKIPNWVWFVLCAIAGSVITFLITRKVAKL